VTGVILIYDIMKKVFNILGPLFLLACFFTALLFNFGLVKESALVVFLSYASYFFVGSACLVALIWFCIGVTNLIKFYYEVWKDKREYEKER